VKVVLDQGTPAPLRKSLPTHSVVTAYELGWATLKNGEFIQQAEVAGYELLITTDQNLKYQQNLAVRKIAILVLSTTSWPRIERAAEQINQAIQAATPGSYIEFAVP
jgi:hypothetical protein